MNTKLLLCLTILGGCFCSRTTQAFWMTIPLSRTNFAAAAPFLRIVPTRSSSTNNPTVQFSIFVLPKDNGGAELLSGLLTVKDSQRTEPLLQTQVQVKELPEGVTPAAVPKSWAGKCKVFRFFIADRLLPNSEFSVDFTADPKWGTAGTAYRFNLKEFADE